MYNKYHINYSLYFYRIKLYIFAQSVGAVEHTNCTSAGG